MPDLLNTLLNLRKSIVLLTATLFLLLSYFLLPTWLNDDIYLAILTPYFQWFVLGCLGLTLLLAIGVYLPLRREQTPTETDPLSTLSGKISQLPTQGRKRFSINAISQFLLPPTWSIEFMQQLNAEQFTRLCLAYYEVKGIPHTTHRLGASTGLNILIWQNDIVSKVIHCSNDQEVQMNSLRQFLGVLVHERALGGVYIHRGKFNEEVRNFAASHNIQLRNEYALLAKIEGLSERRKQKLLKTIQY